MSPSQCPSLKQAAPKAYSARCRGDLSCTPETHLLPVIGLGYCHSAGVGDAIGIQQANQQDGQEHAYRYRGDYTGDLLSQIIEDTARHGASLETHADVNARHKHYRV